MNTLKKVLAWTLGVLAIALAGASMWFWFTPVGLNNYVNKITIQLALDSPQTLTQIGIIDDTLLDFHSGKLDDQTAAFEKKMLQRAREARAGLDRYGPKGLQGQELLTWKITAWFLDDAIRQGEKEYSRYRINQISGSTVDIPQFLTDAHVIKSRRSAERYLSRLTEFGRVLRESEARVVDDRAHGVVPPDFVIAQTLVGMRAFIDGGAEKNALVTTLPEKLAKVTELRDADRRKMLSDAKDIVQREVIPGYKSLIALFEDMQKTATHDAGIWRLPEGGELYAIALQSNTTTKLNAEQIHELGLSEVARIEAEMRSILDAQGVAGDTLAARIHSLNTRADQVFADDDSGRAQMLAYLKSVDARVMAAAPRFFKKIPPQPLEIVRVPIYSQDSAPGGYYNPPALDGSRPGRFYINQKNTADNPKFTLPTLMVHEGSPGHHFQLSAAQTIEGVPLLRKVLPFSAYAEGWALYAERIAKTEMGIYDTDALGDLGRLQAEMFRAVRLVVDTGMHAKRWSREQAIEYMIAKTGMTEAEVTREIERYVVWPGQPTSYKVGQLAILRARERAQRELGERFDVKGFHEVLLMNGSMPLEVLDDVVGTWITKQKSAG